MNADFTPPAPTWLEVDLSAIEQNTRVMRQVAGAPLMAVLKGNAYGLGALEISRSVLAAGAEWLAVARWSEARLLRQAGITAPILVFGYAVPGEVDEAIAEGVTLTLHSWEAAEVYPRRAAALGKTLRVHLKIDTGLHRLGIQPGEAAALVQQVRAAGGVEIEGVYSHLAMADDAETSETLAMTRQQVRLFEETLAALAQAGLRPRWVHLAGSSGAIYHPETRYNLVRAGCGILGVPPRTGVPLLPGLRCAAAWKTVLADCRTLPAGTGVGYGHAYLTGGEERIGLLPVGYVDGFRRVPGNQVLIGGQRAPVVGRMCMDMCLVRLPLPFPPGTEVTLFGRQGDEQITYEELAERWHTTEVDVLANVNARVPRVYLRG